MSELSQQRYNNWLFNYSTKLNQRLYAAKAYKKPKCLDKNLDYPITEDKAKYPNTTCKPPLLAIRRFIIWIRFIKPKKFIVEKKVYIEKTDQRPCNECFFNQ